MHRPRREPAPEPERDRGGAAEHDLTQDHPRVDTQVEADVDSSFPVVGLRSESKPQAGASYAHMREDGEPHCEQRKGPAAEVRDMPAN